MVQWLTLIWVFRPFDLSPASATDSLYDLRQALSIDVTVSVPLHLISLLLLSPGSAERVSAGLNGSAPWPR